VTTEDLLRFCQAELAWQIDTIVELVRLESPSDDRDALVRCGRALHQMLAEMGARVDDLDPDGACCVVARFGEPSSAPRVLLLGHFDTVWPIGSLPIERRGDALHGPGVYDMKSGLVMAMQAIRALRAHDWAGSAVLLCSSDEEVGSARSRALIEREAQAADAVLVFEPALASGAVKTARKGVGDYRVACHGISAHAGVEPGRGVSAIHELVHQASALLALARHDLGTTVNIGAIAGGTRSNVVAEAASMAVDVRVTSLAEADRIAAAMTRLVPRDARGRLEVSGGINRPPMERSAAVVRLYEKAREVAAELGEDLAEGATGGASDGNFTAALGVPTLDGLGALGDGAHARHEHVRLDALAQRSAIVAGLIARLTGAARLAGR
jgi:glutamate carboxypeptidase